jgi:hypothetical protein
MNIRGDYIDRGISQVSPRKWPSSCGGVSCPEFSECVNAEAWKAM